MSTFIATISGLTPLLIHRWAEAQETEEGTRAIHIERRDPRQEATKVRYYVATSTASSLIKSRHIPHIEDRFE